jgi:hypothetical protein
MWAMSFSPTVPCGLWQELHDILPSAAELD